MAVKLFLLLVFAMSVTFTKGQRPGFAGSKPIGYPELYDKPTTDGLADRFGEDATTQRLPIEANGDRDLIDRLSKLPIDKQPFWFINWQALEANRNKPQTYPQKPNDFVDNIPNTGTQSGTNAPANRVVPNTNSNTGNSNDELPNRFSGTSSVASSTSTGSNQVANNNGANSNTGTQNRVSTKPSANVASSSTEPYQGVSSGTSNTNSGIENRFSAAGSTSKGVNYRDGNERYSGHKRFYPRNPVIDN